MVGAVLNPDQGISHQLFGAGGGEGEEEEGNLEEEPSEETGETQTKDILKTYKHKYVPHVVRKKDIHFWTVPRLGAFMAVPMIYNSCMSDEALDAAITDWTEVSKKIEAQDAKKAEWDEEQAQIKEQKISAGEPYEYQEGEWEDLKPEPYATTEQKFVICVDTLG